MCRILRSLNNCKINRKYVSYLFWPSLIRHFSRSLCVPFENPKRFARTLCVSVDQCVNNGEQTEAVENSEVALNDPGCVTRAHPTAALSD